MVHKIIFSVLFLFINANISFGQFELRIRPLDLLFEDYNLHLEYPINKEISLELNGNYLDSDNEIGVFNLRKNNALRVAILAKYYFRPIIGNDRFFTAAYLSYNQFEATDFNFFTTRFPRFQQKDITPGIAIGHKWLGYGGFNFEVYTTYGQSIWATRRDLNFDDEPTRENFTQEFLFNVSLGYRFTDKKKHK